MQLELDRGSRWPLYLQIVDQIKERIRNGSLPVGTRLPPGRQVARDLGLTRLTVHNAYAELQADGWIESFVGRGSFVARRPASTSPQVESASTISAAVRRPGELADLLQLSQQPEIISFAQASPAPETFPLREFGRAVQQAITQDGAALYGYGTSQGDLVLREQLASEHAVRMLRPNFGLLASLGIDGVMVTSRAAGEPYDFVSRYFAPASGIDEDPATGSAHCCLGPFWAARLGKIELLAYQASARGGVIRVRVDGDRVKLGGQAVTVLQGELSDEAA